MKNKSKSGRNIELSNPIAKTESTGNEVDVEQMLHKQHVDKLIYDWSLTAEYEEGISSDVVINALSNFSDLNLQAPWELYKAIADKANAIDNGSLIYYTYHEMNVVLQIVGMCSAKQLNMSLETYIVVKERLIAFSKKYDKSLADHKARIREENVAISDLAVNQVGEA